MKNFPKLLLFLSLLEITNQSFAQFGLRIGTNLSKQKIELEGESQNDGMKMLPGFNLGFVLDFPVSDQFSIETGLLLNTKGYKIKTNENDSTYKEFNYLAYLDIPMNAKYTFDLGGPRFYLSAGPCISLGVFGKGGYVANTNTKDYTQEWDFEWGEEAINSHKRFDIGFNIGGGFEFGSFVIGANYGIGLTNIATVGSIKTKNRVLSISIGANFRN